MVGRFFQRFQECVCRADGHTIGVVDQADFSFPDERSVHDLLFDLADLLDLDLRRREFAIRFDNEKVRVGAGFNLQA